MKKGEAHMNQSHHKISTYSTFPLIFIIIASCSTLPKEYVPDDKIVYLKQPFYLVPVKYNPEKASPYKFIIDPQIDQVYPGILSLFDFNKVLEANIDLDAKIYKETKKYWNVTFDGSVIYNKLLSWDNAAAHNTSDYPVDTARTLYAQSYKMVDYLISAYKTAKVVNYIASFKVSTAKNNSDDIREKYKTNFKKIFGVSWEENAVNFEKYIVEEKKK